MLKFKLYYFFGHIIYYFPSLWLHQELSQWHISSRRSLPTVKWNLHQHKTANQTWFSSLCRYMYTFSCACVCERESEKEFFQFFCPWRSTERLTALMPGWFQLKHSHQQTHSLCRLHPDLPITIHHCFYLPFAKDGGKTVENVWQEKKRERQRVRAGIDWFPHVLKPDIDFLSFFQMGKSALSDWRRFLWGFGERGVEMSIRCFVVSCGLCIGLW